MFFFHFKLKNINLSQFINRIIIKFCFKGRKKSLAARSLAMSAVYQIVTLWFSIWNNRIRLYNTIISHIFMWRHFSDHHSSSRSVPLPWRWITPHLPVHALHLRGALPGRKSVLFVFWLVQVSLVIRGIYVQLFLTANTEFADKKTQIDCKLYLFVPYFICE